MKIQAVFFDMGGTIETLCFTHQMRLEATKTLRQKLEDAGVDLPAGDEQLLDFITSGLSRYKKWSILTEEELPPERIWAEYIFEGAQAGKRISEKLAEDLLIFLESNYYRRELRPEVPAVLEAIKQMGLKMGVISNISSYGLVPSVLEQYGISHYFSPVVLSSQYGHRKPDPAI